MKVTLIVEVELPDHYTNDNELSVRNLVFQVLRMSPGIGPNLKQVMIDDRPNTCNAQYGDNPHLCYLHATHRGPHTNKFGTTWHNEQGRPSNRK